MRAERLSECWLLTALIAGLTGSWGSLPGLIARVLYCVSLAREKDSDSMVSTERASLWNHHKVERL